MGYTHPTPVQRIAIPAVLAGDDLMVQAKTGSGKTLAFGLPILNKIDPMRPDCQALAIAPTRELALQVASEITRAAAGLTMVAAVYGGVPLKEHLTAAQWSSFLVGTPGRIRDLLERGNLRLDHVRVVVLDEADEMLDMGFKKDLEFILDAARGRQQTLLFSATFPQDIVALGRKYMREPKRLQAEPAEQTPVAITHRAVRTTPERRLDTLIDVLKREAPESAIIFCQTKTETPWLARKLKYAGFSADCLHGDMNQGQRFNVL
ncbi:MAG: DEAD/DEAH box helicase, partial [Cyanobacteria bacterium REEB65]|nr:DEAD/DEAH box helicase [Cyanobacteria bacterium REEB65]